MKRTLLATVALLVATAVPAYPHGGGVIRLASTRVAGGGTVALAGEKLEKNSDLSLELRGTLDNYPVGRVHTDPAGKFNTNLTLPPNIPGGSYTLVAIAADGDVTARAEVVIGSPPGGAGTPMPGMRGNVGMHTEQEISGPHATAAMMQLKQTTSTGEWGVIAALILFSFAGGAWLLTRPRRLSRNS